MARSLLPPTIANSLNTHGTKCAQNVCENPYSIVSVKCKIDRHIHVQNLLEYTRANAVAIIVYALYWMDYTFSISDEQKCT